MSESTKPPVCFICGLEFDLYSDTKTRALQDQHVKVLIKGYVQTSILWDRIEFEDAYCASGEASEIIMCPGCFETKLIPWVESFGHRKVDPRPYDW